MKYYLAVNGQSTGPYEPYELLSMGASASSMVWNETMPSWVEAGSVPELAPIFNQVANYPAMDATQVIEQRFPQFNSPGEIPPRPDVAKGKSILGLFGVTPLGVLGLVFGGIANKRYDEGNYEEAENKARLARKFGRLGFIFFFVTLAIIILIVLMEIAFISAISYY